MVQSKWFAWRKKGIAPKAPTTLLRAMTIMMTIDDDDDVLFYFWTPDADSCRARTMPGLVSSYTLVGLMLCGSSQKAGERH